MARASILASRPPAVLIAAAASAIAAQVHAWAAPEHLALKPLLGVGFLVVAFLQGAYAVALLSRCPAPMLVRLGLVGSLALICLALVADTPGQPLAWLLEHQHAPGADLLEQVGLASEACLAAALAVLLMGGSITRCNPVTRGTARQDSVVQP